MILTLLVIIAVLIVIVYLGVNKHTQTPDTPRCKHRDCFTRRNQHERKGAGWPCTRPIKIKNAAKGKMKRTQLVDYPESSDSDFEIVQPKKKVKGLSEVQELRGLMKQQDRISAALGRPVPDTPAPSGSGIYADDGEVASSSKIYVPSPPREIFYPNEIWDTSDATNIKLLGSRSFPTDLECVAVSPDRLTHVCGGVNSTTYLSLFVGVDDDAHADLSSKYKDSINRLSEEDSNKIFGFSRPAQPTKQSDIPAQYIPRDPSSPSRGASHDVTSVDSVTSSYSVTSIPPPTDAELSSMISPISISPVSEEGCKRESSCSDSGVDVTSLSIC